MKPHSQTWDLEATYTRSLIKPTLNNKPLITDLLFLEYGKNNLQPSKNVNFPDCGLGGAHLSPKRPPAPECSFSISEGAWSPICHILQRGNENTKTPAPADPKAGRHKTANKVIYSLGPKTDITVPLDPEKFGPGYRLPDQFQKQLPLEFMPGSLFGDPADPELVPEESVDDNLRLLALSVAGECSGILEFKNLEERFETCQKELWDKNRVYVHRATQWLDTVELAQTNLPGSIKILPDPNCEHTDDQTPSEYLHRDNTKAAPKKSRLSTDRIQQELCEGPQPDGILLTTGVPSDAPKAVKDSKSVGVLHILEESGAVTGAELAVVQHCPTILPPAAPSLLGPGKGLVVCGIRDDNIKAADQATTEKDKHSKARERDVESNEYSNKASEKDQQITAREINHDKCQIDTKRIAEQVAGEVTSVLSAQMNKTFGKIVKAIREQGQQLRQELSKEIEEKVALEVQKQLNHQVPEKNNRSPPPISELKLPEPLLGESLPPLLGFVKPSTSEDSGSGYGMSPDPSWLDVTPIIAADRGTIVCQEHCQRQLGDSDKMSNDMSKKISEHNSDGRPNTGFTPLIEDLELDLITPEPLRAQNIRITQCQPHDTKIIQVANKGVHIQQKSKNPPPKSPAKAASDSAVIIGDITHPKYPVRDISHLKYPNGRKSDGDQEASKAGNKKIDRWIKAPIKPSQFRKLGQPMETKNEFLTANIPDAIPDIQFPALTPSRRNERFLGFGYELRKPKCSSEAPNPPLGAKSQIVPSEPSELLIDLDSDSNYSNCMDLFEIQEGVRDDARRACALIGSNIDTWWGPLL
ncbi:hypothetical protein H072_1091 [Dactylellina haptotyla CBS 200.50]|uniref:Uncharacterized protein n=1 Tax=Dactylellina haptotyla (strain CBS 200.50) TaxID=1284197 RepID=S8AQ09_DACHA|nr:hypothetical protein H072_1091 [Dactylellina haptotyla CBS 200.50]